MLLQEPCLNKKDDFHFKEKSASSLLAGTIGLCSALVEQSVVVKVSPVVQSSIPDVQSSEWIHPGQE